MSMLATTGNAPLPGLKDMVADTLTHKAKEKKAEAEKSTQELGDNHEMSTTSTVGTTEGTKGK